MKTKKLKFEYAVCKGINEALGKQFGEVNQQGEPSPSLVSKNVEQDPNTNSISVSTSDSTSVSKRPQMEKKDDLDTGSLNNNPAEIQGNVSTDIKQKPWYNVCRFYNINSCNKDQCPYKHVFVKKCRFFSSLKGCKNGKECNFLHIKTQKNNTEGSKQKKSFNKISRSKPPRFQAAGSNSNKKRNSFLGKPYIQENIPMSHQIEESYTPQPVQPVFQSPSQTQIFPKQILYPQHQLSTVRYYPIHDYYPPVQQKMYHQFQLPQFQNLPVSKFQNVYNPPIYSVLN